MQHAFRSKILLFGEYAIIQGGAALALPYKRFSAYWSKDEHPKSLPSRQALWQLLSYIETQPELRPLCDCARMNEDLAEGWYIYSDIPQGYGLGSSGAVVAAVFDKYFEPVADLALLKSRLAQLESCFHGASSGLDPLVCYTQKAVFMEASKPQLLEALPLPTAVFLLDSEQSRSTGPLVQRFKQRCQTVDFTPQLEAYKRLNQAAIAAWQQQSAADLCKAAKDISVWQLEHFKDMIPNNLLGLWEEGLASGQFSLKLCGAGGGGYMLAFANLSPFEAAEYFVGIKTLQI